MLLKKLGILSIVWMLSAPGMHAKQWPPVGKRSYILQETNPYAPVNIKPLNGEASKTEAAHLMRDPIPLGSKGVSPSKSALTKKAQPVRKTSRMVFDQVAVQGRYLVPRVSFDRPALELERVEESIQVDYRGKIKESDSLLREFDW